MVSFMTLQYSGCALSLLDASIHFLRYVYYQQMECACVLFLASILLFFVLQKQVLVECLVSGKA